MFKNLKSATSSSSRICYNLPKRTDLCPVRTNPYTGFFVISCRTDSRLNYLSLTVIDGLLNDFFFSTSIILVLSSFSVFMSILPDLSVFSYPLPNYLITPLFTANYFQMVTYLYFLKNFFSFLGKLVVYCLLFSLFLLLFSSLI